MKSRKIAFLAILTSMALVLSLFENFLSLPLPVPGAKLGLSNIVILTTIAVFGGREGLIVALLKSLLLMIFTGAVTSFFYSLAGALLASVTMALSLRFFYPSLSLVGISEMGSFAHNLGQILVACLVFHNGKILSYLPFLSLVGLVTGFFVGLACRYLLPRLDRLLKKGGLAPRERIEAGDHDKEESTDHERIPPP